MCRPQHSRSKYIAREANIASRMGYIACAPAQISLCENLVFTLHFIHKKPFHKAVVHPLVGCEFVYHPADFGVGGGVVMSVAPAHNANGG